MKNNARKLIKESTDALRELMQVNLAAIADSIINKVMKKARTSTPANILKSVNDITPAGVNDYTIELKESMAVIAREAINGAKKEVPKVKIQFGEYENLPSKVRKRIKAQNDLLINTQVADLEKSIFFQFNSSALSTDSMNQIAADLRDEATSYIEGNSVYAGAGATASNIVNEARNAFFFEDEVLQEIEAFEFVNGDPVSPICIELSGTVFAKDDPNMFRYTPPLHYNCKSTIYPILNLGKKEITRLNPSKKSIESIQFSEEASCHGCGCHPFLKGLEN